MDKLAVVIVDSKHCIFTILEKHPYLPTNHKLYINRTVNSISEYNNLLTSIEFWENIKEENILIIQHDSALLRTGIEEFYKWDYVGAPWKFQQHGGNGGLSFRKKSAMIECLKNVPYNGVDNEDIYFSNALKFLGMNLAPREICEQFSCETIFKLGTLGTHAVEKYLTPELINKIKTQYE